jgi:hypothetical protein
MFSMLSRLFGSPAGGTRRAGLADRRPRPSARPTLEALEERAVPTVTPHAYSVLPNVQVQALYYGSNWYNDPSLFQQTGQFEGFLHDVVHSSYVDMLTNAGYDVGRGSWSGGKINMSNLGSVVQDSDVRNAIQSSIDGGNPLAPPGGNRLYVVYVEPNVEVFHDNQNSVRDFVGYHDAFNGADRYGHAVTIHYAVITTPGGTVGNHKNHVALNNFDEMTTASSHELAEAITDPNSNGWRDDAFGDKGEIGDLANGQVVYLDGYAVQREADRNDQPMTPAGARAVRPVNFVLQPDGSLYEQSAAGTIHVPTLGAVASISDQGIDDNGRAMIDLVTTNGLAFEYSDGDYAPRFLTGGAISAKAGQGVSYVLTNGGTVLEHKDSDGSLTWKDSNVTSIDAGTDRYGVNAFTEVWFGSAYEVSDSTGFHYVAWGVKSVSAGQMGYGTYLTSNDVAYLYSDQGGTLRFLGSKVAQVKTGTDANGNYVIDMLGQNGELWRYQPSTDWQHIIGNVRSIGKEHAGTVDVVFTWGDAWALGPTGWSFLMANQPEAAA